MQSDESTPLATTQPSGRLVRARQALALTTRKALGATPVTIPIIDSELTSYTAVERSAEVIRDSTAKAEYWLSPGGTLRSVLRLCIKAALLLGLPVIIIGPVVLLALEYLAAASASLAIVAANLADLSISLIVAFIGFAVLIALIRSHLRLK